MRYPEFLQNGGTIGFPAPSFGCSTEPYSTRFDAALERFSEWGYKLNPGPNSRAGEGIGISNTPAKCGKELTDMYLDPANDVLIACGGGELMCEILEHVDLGAMKQATPRWIMGYSDITNIVHPLLTLCDTASIYGPCAPAFGIRELHDSVSSAFDILRGRLSQVHSYDLHEKFFYDEEPVAEDSPEPDPLEKYKLTEKSLKAVYDGKKYYPSGEYKGELEFSGRLIGGCMDCLVNLIGTPFEDTKGFLDRYEKDGVIWCLESCDLNVFDIRRAMWHMEKAGWFRKGIVKGFIFGRPYNGQDMMGLTHIGSVMPYVEKYEVPALLDADLGHVYPAMPIVVGSIGHVKVSGNDVKLQMEFA